MRKTYLVAMASVISLVSANLVHATLIANDTFPVSPGGSATTYNDGTGLPNGGVALFGQTPTATGFSTAGWTSGIGSTANLITDASTNGYAGQVDWLGVSDQNSRSNARNLTTAQGSANFVYYTATELVRNIDPSSGSIVANDFIGAGFANSILPVAGATSGYQTGNLVGFAQTSATDPGSLVIRTRVTSAKADADTILVNADPSSAGYVGSSIAGNEYLVITKDETNINGSIDRITYWVNPTDLTSEATMDATAQYTDYLSPLANYSLGGTNADLPRDNIVAIGFSPTVTFQQTALSTDLAGLAAVVETPTAVPEPASIGLVGVAALSTLSRRRRVK